jgi:ATP-binding cassette subfamily F protein 3
MLTIADVSKSYGTRQLFSEVSLFIARTDRLGLIGPNGAGKSTLFGLILGEEKPDTGTIEWERGADFGYLPQESAPAGDETILHIATSGKKLEPTDDDYDIDYTLEPRARKILDGLGFKPDDADKLAKTFSGCWVMRAHLARLLVAEPALLLLDEPTNHLDLKNLEWLEQELAEFPGAVLVVSHDRWFVSELATRVVEITPEGPRDFPGTYAEYLARLGDDHLDADVVVSRARAALGPSAGDCGLGAAGCAHASCRCAAIAHRAAHCCGGEVPALTKQVSK